MFRFEEPSGFYLLVLIPLLIIAYIIYARLYVRRRADFATAAAWNRLLPDFSFQRRNIKMGLLSLGILLMVVAYANPQWGTKRQKVQAKSTDVFIALDVSESMYCEDIAPNRMERAKRAATQIVEGLRGNRIGLIIFAGSAFLQMPLTNDYSAAELFIKSSSPDLIGNQGTAIGDAIDLAIQALEDDEGHQKALVVITDGENHEGNTMEKVDLAKEEGLSIFPLGVATQKGGYIPERTIATKGFKRDHQGNLVVSKLDEDVLVDLAAGSNGKHFLIQEGQGAIDGIVSEVDLLEKKEVEQMSFTEYNSYFQYFLALGLLFLLLDYFISEFTTWRTNKLFDI